MGMTNNQFKSYIRLVLENLLEIKEEKDKQKSDEKLEKLIASLRAALED